MHAVRPFVPSFQAEERTLRAEELVKEALELGRCAAAQAEGRRKAEVQMLWIDNIKLHGMFNARGLIGEEGMVRVRAAMTCGRSK